MTRPLRLIILHFSQIGFTDGLTFMEIPPLVFSALAAPGDPTAGQIIGRKLDSNFITGIDADKILAHLSRDMRHYLVAVGQLHAEHGVGKGLNDLSIHFDDVIL
jgi:hypothetical protein